MKGFPDLPPLWTLGFMILAWGLGRWLPGLQAQTVGLMALGLGIAGLGLALIFWSGYWFWRKKTTIEPHHRPGTLIVEGPYRLSRNPIYLGLVLILSGQIIWHGALTPVLLPPLLVLILGRRFAAPEEAQIIEVFGEKGRDYLSATRRWL